MVRCGPDRGVLARRRLLAQNGAVGGARRVETRSDRQAALRGAPRRREAPVPPLIIQGGMGIGVSGWQLAGAVGRAGGLGVVSGVALDVLMTRRLQDGDHDGHLRDALSRFPVPEIASRVLSRYFRRGGRERGEPYQSVPRLTLQPSIERQQLAVVAAFAEVHLATRAAGGNRVGINFLEKLQLATPAAAFGAILAGVDTVLVGAGIPTRIPSLLDALSRQRRAELPIDVVGAGNAHHALSLDPAQLLGRRLPALSRPRCFAIISSTTLASFLARDETTRPDGFVVEGAVAGGHNAPPRGRLQVDERGEPVYGPRDAADLTEIAALGLPYWLAGGYGREGGLATAVTAGASGIQVGTPFALARESGLDDPLRQLLLDGLDGPGIDVRTDVRASPTGFPFKVAQLPGTLSEPDVYSRRRRVCDLGLLRTLYTRADGTVGYRCPAEPAAAYARKGGDRSHTVGRICLCNGLTATVGLGQCSHDGTTAEPPIVTLGADLIGARELRQRHPDGWGAADVIEHLSGHPTGPLPSADMPHAHAR